MQNNLPVSINPYITPEQFAQANPQMFQSNYQGFSQEDVQNLGDIARQIAYGQQNTPNTQDSLKTPEQEQAEIERDIQAVQQARGSQVNPMQERNWNIINNAWRNMQEIGTGINSFLVNAPEIVSSLPQQAKDYFASGKNVNDLVLDAANMVLSSYNIDLRTLPERTVQDILGGVVQGIYENPVDFALDFFSFGGAGLAKKLVKNIPVLSRTVKAGEIESRLGAEAVEGATKLTEYSEKMKKVEDLAKAGGTDLESVLKAAEEGTKLPVGGKEAYKALKEASKDYDSIIKYVSPETYRGMEETAINQKVLRERLKTNPNATFDDVNRETRPLIDLINENKYNEVLDLAKTGNKTAREVVGAKTLYDKGRLIPVTHVGAEVTKGIDTTGKLADAILDAGQFSSRVIGNSTYKAIADSIRKPNEFIDMLSRGYLERNVSGAILRGEMLGTGDAAGKNVMYLNRRLLENGKVRSALEGASKTATSQKDVPIDKDYLISLRDQMSRGETYLSGAAKDIYAVRKGTMLGGGTYVAGNIITGATNAVMNSGAYAISDFINAVKSKGQLAKNLGVYRRSYVPEVNTPGLRFINKLNQFTAKPLGEADKYVQNIWAEMAAHANLRRAGVAASERADFINQMDKAKLGEMVTDVKKVALINSPRTILPRELDAVANTISPFWRWLDTATQSNIHMLSKNPLMSNIVLTDIVANIGFDKELQNRLNLNVYSDKPFVSYKLDSRTGKIQEHSIEMTPLMTSLKLVDANTYMGSGGNPILGAIINSVQGKNAYGGFSQRPEINGVITQAIGTKRFQVLPNGEKREIKGMGDEILNTAIREFVAAPRLYNKTIAPLIASVISPTGEYYQPYDMSMIGSFTPNYQGGNILKSGNPSRGRNIGDVGRAMLTEFSRDYYPDRGITPDMSRRIMRGYNRRMGRLMYGE